MKKFWLYRRIYYVFSRFRITVAPVVVIPEVDSKIESTKLIFISEKKKGNDPNKAMDNPPLLVNKKA